MSSTVLRRGGLFSPTRVLLTFVLICLYFSFRRPGGSFSYEPKGLQHTPTPTPSALSWDVDGEGPSEVDPWEEPEPESAEEDWFDKVPDYLKKKKKPTGKGRRPAAATKTGARKAGATAVSRPWLVDVEEQDENEKGAQDEAEDEEEEMGESEEGEAEADGEEELPIWAHSTTKSSTFKCQENRLADSILLVLKTGATELYSKLPMHLVTTLRCVPHYLIFSDLDQEVQSLHVEDALAEVSPKWKNEHKDFELYRKQQELLREGMDIGLLKGGKGWDLDKWKFLPMIKKTWEKRPLGIRWFVFVEADTYISWHNLLMWLGQLDADNKLYMGSQVMIGSTEFAHGGSGIVISHGAMTRLYEEVRDRKESWEEKMPQNCCGDKVLADALLTRDVKLMRSFPLLQGERAWSVDYSEGHWCKAVVTWHHVKPNEVDDYWRFETEWIRENKTKPILFRDYYHYFVGPNLRETRDDWDNLSGDWKVSAEDKQTDADRAKMDEKGRRLAEKLKDAHTSFEACRSGCEARPECLQFKWSPGICRMGRVPRMGRPTEEKDDVKNLKSGWLLDRVHKYVEKRGKCKASDAWILK